MLLTIAVRHVYVLILTRWRDVDVKINPVAKHPILELWLSTRWVSRADISTCGVASSAKLMANLSGARSSRRRLPISSVIPELYKDLRFGLTPTKRGRQTHKRPSFRMKVSEIWRRRLEAECKVIFTEKRNHTFVNWEAICEAEPRGRWTSKLILNVRPWIERNTRSYY